MRRSTATTLLCIALTAASGAATAAEFASPFFTARNEGALARSFLLPPLGNTRALAADEWRWLAQLDLTNDYHTQALGGESATFDGETTRLGYTFSQGLDHGLEWSVMIPVMYLGGGFLDNFIEDWHRWFGLPKGGREFAPQDRYLYEIVQGGSVVYRNVEKGTALGDIELAGGWEWVEGWVLRAAAKLPTGDDKKLAGDNAGVALWIDAAMPFPADSRWRGFVSLGGSAAQKADILREQQSVGVALGGIGLSWRWTEALHLTAQVNAHSRLYRDSELKALKRPGVQIVFGGSYALLPNALLRLAVQEDAMPTSSPDFSVHMALVLSPAAD
jgi:hypothetical protein